MLKTQQIVFNKIYFKKCFIRFIIFFKINYLPQCSCPCEAPGYTNAYSIKLTRQTFKRSKFCIKKCIKECSKPFLYLLTFLFIALISSL